MKDHFYNATKFLKKKVHQVTKPVLKQAVTLHALHILKYVPKEESAYICRKQGLPCKKPLHIETCYITSSFITQAKAPKRPGIIGAQIKKK